MVLSDLSFILLTSVTECEYFESNLIFDTIMAVLWYGQSTISKGSRSTFSIARKDRNWH
jgi:hypothetical protein